LVEGDQAGDPELLYHALMIRSQVGHCPAPALKQQIQEGSDERVVEIYQYDDGIAGTSGIHDRGVGRIVC
jgi:hypothetical protein